MSFVGTAGIRHMVRDISIIFDRAVNHVRGDCRMQDRYLVFSPSLYSHFPLMIVCVCVCGGREGSRGVGGGEGTACAYRYSYIFRNISISRST